MLVRVHNALIGKPFQAERPERQSDVGRILLLYFLHMRIPNTDTAKFPYPCRWALLKLVSLSHSHFFVRAIDGGLDGLELI